MREYFIRHREFHYPTSDDWYPNFPRNCVRVSVMEWKGKKEDFITFRVAVWGEDDFGMEYDLFIIPSEKEMVLNRILKEVDNFPNPLTKLYLKERGFTNA